MNTDILSDFDFMYQKVPKVAKIVRMKQDKNLREKNSEMEIINLLDKKFKVMVKRTLTKLERKMYKQSENFNREIGNIRKYQIKVTELKYNN